MKKLLSISVTSLALAAMAAYTPTTVGVTKVTTSNKSTIVPVAYKSLSTGESIAVADLVKSANLPGDTMLYVYDGTKYYAYINGGGTWTGVTTVSTIDGVNTPEAGTTTLTLAAGSAVWIVLKDTPSSSQDIYVYGAYQTGVTSTAIAGKTTLIANPLQSTATVAISGVTKGDVIMIPKGDTTNPDIYTCMNVEGSVPTWKKSRVTVSLPDFDMGQGFWYVSKGASDATLTWTTKN